MPTQLTAEQKKALRDIFGEQDCLFSPEELLVYTTDASRICGEPLATVRAADEGQIVALMRWATREKVPVYPRARATNTMGGCTPTAPGVVLSLLKMNAILEIDEHDFVVVTQPGVVTKDLQKAVEAKGLMYPPDPASFDVCTIGGNIATCAGGMSAVKYGVTRDYLLATRVVLPDGTVAVFGARTHKNVVGLDVNRLLCGSEGTLGVITEMTLKLIPLPEASASILVGFDSLKAAMDCVRNVFATGILPCALEFIGEQCLKPIAQMGHDIFPAGVTTCLLIKLDGARDTLAPQIDKLLRVVEPMHPAFLRKGLTREDEEELWTVRRLINAGSALVAPNKIADDVTVPRSRLHEALTGIDAVGRRSGLTVLTFGHVGDGNIHVNIMFDAATQQDIATRAKLEINELIISLRGVLSGEHGIGLSKAKTFRLQIGAVEQNLMRGIKAVFDPDNIMNPGKSY
jgi:D-lactate dehydrogenase (cytochrome)/glycolate oxidase